MDLESESSTLESVDDNGLMQQSSNNIADDGRSLDNGSFSDESVKLVSNSTSAELGKPVSFGSPGGASSPISKGQGLRKWRRIRRDLTKDTSANMDNSKVFKRGLPGLVLPHGKQMQFQSPEAEQESQGSVGSVNMLKNTSDGFEILGTDYDPRFVAGVGFSAGMDSEKDDDRSSKSSTATRAPKVIRYAKPMIGSGHRGKCRVENSKKHRGESVVKENSFSSLESDSRKQRGRMMDHNGDNGQEADRNGVRPTRKNNVGGGTEELIIKNNRFAEDLDPLNKAIDDLLTLQEALGKEVQQFQEIDRELMTQHHGQDSEVSSSHSEIVTLLNSVEQLEIKLEETRYMLEMKESHIRELESTTNQKKHLWGDAGFNHRGTEDMVEDIFRQNIEAEIEYLIYSRSVENLNIQMKAIKQQEAWAEDQAYDTMKKLGEVQTKAENLTNRGQDLQECIKITGTNKKRACKITSYFLLQLVLLLTVVLLFMSQLLPESETVVVPT